MREEASGRKCERKMRKDRFLSRWRRQGGKLINVTPFWAILMANVRDPEPGGGAAGSAHEHG